MTPEAVHLPEVAGRDHLDAGLGEQAREVLPLVAQRVVLGRHDQGGRQAREPVGAQGCQVGVLQVGRGGGVLLPVPRGVAWVEAVGGGGVGVEAGGRVEERVDQRHRGEAAGVAQRRHQRQVAAGAVAVRERRAAQAVRATLAVEPRQDGVDVVRGRREPVLGRAAVVDAEHGQAAAVGQPAGRGVVHVDVVEDEAAPVQVHDQAVGGTRRAVEPRRDPVAVEVDDLRDVLDAARPARRRAPAPGTRRGRRRRCASRRRSRPPRRRGGPPGRAPPDYRCIRASRPTASAAATRKSTRSSGNVTV